MRIELAKLIFSMHEVNVPSHRGRRHPVEKIDFFNGMCGSDCSIEKVFEAHRISHHPTRYTITPYNSSDAGLTAAAAAAAGVLLMSLGRKNGLM